MMNVFDKLAALRNTFLKTVPNKKLKVRSTVEVA